MSLIDALADHIGETYNTLAQGRPGQQARAWVQETQAKHDPMSIAMGFAPIGMTSGPYKKLFLPPKGFDARRLDVALRNRELNTDLAAQLGLLWDMGGFMPVSRMPLEKFLQEGPINHFQHFYNEGIPKGIIKMPGPRGEIQSISYMGLEDAKNDLLNFKRVQHPYFSLEQPFDPSKQLVTNGKVNLASDPYFAYNAAFEPNNLNYKPDGKSVYNPLYQKQIQDYVERNQLLPNRPTSHARVAHQQRIYDKAFSIPPKELINELERYNRALDVYGLPQGSQMYLTRAEFPFAPKKEHPEHYNSYSTPTEFLDNFNEGVIAQYNNFPGRGRPPEAYVEELKNNRRVLGQDAKAVNAYNSYASPHPFFDSDRIAPKDALETIVLTKPGVNPLVTPHSVLVKQKDIEHKMPLWEYVQYFLKHGVTPFALGGMMINNSKENK